MLVSNDSLRFFVCQNDAMVNILRMSAVQPVAPT